MTLQEATSIDRQSSGPAPGGVTPALVISGLAKRGFDVIAAAAGLALLSPVLLASSIAIKLDSSGSIFSRETRYGYRNRPIQVLKFRTLTAGAEVGRGNLRLTRIGRILRRSGVDNLPLLFNVLAGDMSIVGPHPFAGRPDTIDPGIAPLLSRIKPGMIDYAQTAEPRAGDGMTERRIKDDLRYAESWSLLLDIKLTARKFFT